ncbi:MAG: hypothetical protein FWC80_07205 [Firmicutes bacterium]|nr:hypothetical protein [Bacillota bacterium]
MNTSKKKKRIITGLILWLVVAPVIFLVAIIVGNAMDDAPAMGGIVIIVFGIFIISGFVSIFGFILFIVGLCTKSTPMGSYQQYTPQQYVPPQYPQQYTPQLTPEQLQFRQAQATKNQQEELEKQNFMKETEELRRELALDKLKLEKEALQARRGGIVLVTCEYCLSEGKVGEICDCCGAVYKSKN